MNELLKDCIKKVCALLLIKCAEEETDGCTIECDYEHKGIKCKLKADFKIYEVEDDEND